MLTSLDKARSVSASAALIADGPVIGATERPSGRLVTHTMAGAILSAPARTDSRPDRVRGLVERQGETL
jgi:hypothetical protein